MNNYPDSTETTLNEKEASKIIGISVGTLRNWRSQRQGPPYYKVGRRVLYSSSDLRRFLNEHQILPFSSGI
jgi:hypothetical protein